MGSNTDTGSSEAELIAAIKKKILKQPTTRLGIGDDAAILKRIESDTLLCSDMMIESVHFDLKFTTAFDLGHKALASTLSDIAAMGGKATAALVSLAVPQPADRAWVEEYFEGANALAREFAVEIVGGDLSRSPGPVFVDVCCYGFAEKPILRSGARAGDLIAVSGFPGLSAAGLEALRANDSSVPEAALRAHRRPRPRLDLIPYLSKLSCTSMIDISDGVSSEAWHLAKASGVIIELDARRFPVHSETLAWARARGSDYTAWTLSGGEDYELLITFDPGSVTALPDDFTVIGKVVAGAPGVFLTDKDGQRSGLDSKGFDHFPKSI